MGILCFALAAGPAVAQQNSPGVATNPDAAAAPAAQAGTAQAGATPAKDPTVKQFTDWTYRCSNQPVNEQFMTQCEIVQIRQLKKENNVVNVLILALTEIAPEKKGDKPNVLLTSVVPLNIFLPEGLLFSIDGKEIARIPYRNCNQQGCWAQVVLDEKTLNVLKKGNEGLGRMRVANGQSIDVKFSLKGFSAALTELQNAAGKKK